MTPSLPRTPLCAIFACASLLGTVSPAQAVNTYATTQYPILLVHGMGGSGANGGADYWPGIVEDLRQEGATVYAADLSPFNSDTVRGEQLIYQIRTVLATSGATKVNLISHSQGGLTARYAAAALPEAVASITTIGTPHHGTGLADFARTLVPAVLPADLLVSLIAPQATDPVTMVTTLDALTSAGAAQFNARFPAGLTPNCATQGPATVEQGGHTQRVFSWTGSTPINNLRYIDWKMAATGAIIVARGQGSNDGTVPVCSARFGQVLGTYRWNHNNEINRISGLLTPGTPDPATITRTHANRLKTLGL